MYHNDNMEYIRKQMIENLSKMGITSGKTLDTMYSVPRHFFVSEALKFSAYRDTSLPIGHGQTISKPSVIGLMVQALNLSGDERVLEIGTGSGYQSAILGLMCKEVVSMERIEELSLRASNVLSSMGFGNVSVINNDDFNAAGGEFDAIVVSAGADEFPVQLLDKLTSGGVLIIPLEKNGRHLIRKYQKRKDNSILEEIIGEAKFVPYIRESSPLAI